MKVFFFFKKVHNFGKMKNFLGSKGARSPTSEHFGDSMLLTDQDEQTLLVQLESRSRFSSGIML